jgi:hypothetical protein
MAERKDGERTESGAAQAGQPDGSTLRSEHGALPAVDSPPLSPADPEPELALERKLEPKPEPEVEAATAAADTGRDADPVSDDIRPVRLQAMLSAALSRLNALSLPSWQLHLPRVRITPRYRRRLTLAVSVLLAAAFGAAVGSLVGGGADTPTPDKKAQAAIAELGSEVATLKAELAAQKASLAAQVVTGEKVAEVETTGPSASPDITGSIPPTSQAMPIPPPRPAGRIAAVASRPPLVRGWTLRLARNGLFLVEGRGDIYQVVPGVPLPGLGPVRAIRRQNGRWVVETPKGLIVARRDRRHFK